MYFSEIYLKIHLSILDLYLEKYYKFFIFINMMDIASVCFFVVDYLVYLNTYFVVNRQKRKSGR